MRKILISVLLASAAAATPALAQPGNWSDHQQAREDRQQVREDRQQAREERQQSRSESRAERPANVERPQITVDARQARQVDMRQQMEMRQQAFTRGGGDMRQQGFEARDGERFSGRADRGNFTARVDGNGTTYVAPGPRMVRAPGDDRARLRDQRFQNREQRIDTRDLRESDRPLPNVMRTRNPLIVSNVPHRGTEPPLRVDAGRRLEQIHWNTNWRNDRRYDWRDFRRHHRNRFHFGIFIDPFGWDYQPFSIGYRLWPAYYGNQYWIDSSMYGLPYPPPGCVWVRYWNDALLVDTYSGTVIDVIPGFFW
jgi:Ni/Co efflux regulator RcnB